MKVVVAIDSMKGSLSSMEAGLAAKKGILRADPEAAVIVCPVADGGEGTASALTQGLGGEEIHIKVSDPLGRKTDAVYGIIPEKRMAVMEMAAAAGLTLLAQGERNPLRTTTYGVGEMIADAIDRGCREFVIGIGGSATNDGGAGMLQALGYAFLDQEGKQIPPGGEGLLQLDHIETENVRNELAECTFHIACDVENPLCGKTGASAVFGPQKGADAQMVELLDRALAHYAQVAGQTASQADPDSPGAGAAGGLGFAFRAFLGAQLQSGIDLVLDATDFAALAAQADVVVTGEGRLDGQSVMGKAPVGVARLAKRTGKPVIALAGSVASDAEACNEAGIDAYFPIVHGAVTLEEAMDKENAARNMADTAQQVFRLIRVVGSCNLGQSSLQ